MYLSPLGKQDPIGILKIIIMFLYQNIKDVLSVFLVPTHTGFLVLGGTTPKLKKVALH